MEAIIVRHTFKLTARGDEMKKSEIFGPIKKSESEESIYMQLAEQISELVKSSALKPGDRLPPHRELASLTEVNVTTVTRAFAVLQKRGVVESRPGKGSFIKEPKKEVTPRSGVKETSGICDLSINRPATPSYLSALQKVLPSLAQDSRFEIVQDYHPPEGEIQTRNVFANWFSDATGHDDPNRLIVVNGCQHGLTCVVDAIATSGDVILADSITFHGFISLCSSRDITLKAVASDAEGMLPSAFEEACRRFSPKAVFLMPNFHNPTNATLSWERRIQLSEIARKYAVYIIEDDVCRPLINNPLPSIASKFPDITFYVTSFSKCVAAGARLGIVSAPPQKVQDVSAILRTNCWSTNALVSLAMSKLIEDGSINTIVSEQAKELRHRQGIIRDLLPSEHVHSQSTSPFAWITLPDPWRCASFCRTLKNAGVTVLPGDVFLLDRDQSPAHAIRINANAARSRKELQLAITKIAALLNSGRRKALLDIL